MLEEKEEASVIGVNGAVNSELDLGRVVSNCAWAGHLLVSVEGGENSGVAGKDRVVQCTVIDSATDSGGNSAFTELFNCLKYSR